MVGVFRLYGKGQRLIKAVFEGVGWPPDRRGKGAASPIGDKTKPRQEKLKEGLLKSAQRKCPAYGILKGPE